MTDLLLHPADRADAVSEAAAPGDPAPVAPVAPASQIASASAAPCPARPRTDASPRELRIAASGLEPRERAVLVSLARLLDKPDGLRLRWVEDPADSNTLFVPHDWQQYVPPPRVLVRVLPRELPTPEGVLPGLSIALPLRISNVTQLLEAVTDRIAVAMAATAATVATVTATTSALSRPQPASDAGRPDAPSHASNARPSADAADPYQPSSLHRLHAALLAGLLSGERRRTQLPLQGHASPGLVIDFPAGLVLSPLPESELLQGDWSLEPARRAPADLAWPEPPLLLRLAPLLWRMVNRLANHCLAPRPVTGRYRLRRWPEAAALARPQLPRLVALWIRQPMTGAQAAAAAGLPEAQVSWFLTSAIALGIAVPADDDVETAGTSLPPRERVYSGL